MTIRGATTRAALALLAATALLAAACGGSDDAGPASSLPIPPPAEAPSPPPEPGAGEPESGSLPAPGEPAESEPGDSEPAESEPVESEPGDSEPEPAESEPGDSEPAESEPAESEPGDSEPEPADPDTPAEPPSSADLPWGRFVLADRIAAKLDGFDTLNFVLSSEGTALPVAGEATEDGWEAGTADVARADGREIEGRLAGPFRTDVAAQVAEIDELLEAGEVDCLVVEASDPEAFVDVIDRAVDAGVPVFTVGSDSADSKRFAFYGFDERDAGRLAGAAAGQWASDYGILLRKAALVSSDPEDPGNRDRMKGFVEGVLELQPKLEFVNTPEAGVAPLSSDETEARFEAEAWLAANPDVDLVFHTDRALEPFSLAIAYLSLYGDFYVVGFGINEMIGNLIRDGVIVVAAVEGYADRASRAAEACGDYLLGGDLESGHVVLEPRLVTELNVDDADWRLAANQ